MVKICFSVIILKLDNVILFKSKEKFIFNDFYFCRWKTLLKFVHTRLYRNDWFEGVFKKRWELELIVNTSIEKLVENSFVCWNKAECSHATAAKKKFPSPLTFYLQVHDRAHTHSHYRARISLFRRREATIAFQTPYFALLTRKTNSLFGAKHHQRKWKKVSSHVCFGVLRQTAKGSSCRMRGSMYRIHFQRNLIEFSVPNLKHVN